MQELVSVLTKKRDKFVILNTPHDVPLRVIRHLKRHFGGTDDRICRVF